MSSLSMSNVMAPGPAVGHGMKAYKATALFKTLKFVGNMFGPSTIQVVGGRIAKKLDNHNAIVVVDLGTVVGTGVNFNLAVSATAFKALAGMRAKEEVVIQETSDQYIVTDGFTTYDMPKAPVHIPLALAAVPAGLEVLGAPVTIPDHRNLKRYVGKSGFMTLRLFDGQLEQATVASQSHPYTFNAIAAAALIGREPGIMLSTQIWFRHLKDGQTIKIAVMGDQYWVISSVPYEFQRNLEVYELAQVVS